MRPLPPQPEPQPDRRPAWILAGLLAVVGIAAFVTAQGRLTEERRALVERRLSGTAGILTEPAKDVLARGASREEFLARLRDLGSTTGLRITLIAPDGEALADSEVSGPLPNLGDRPEVRTANLAGSATAARTSVVTGKETVYVARAVEVDGRLLGTIRAAVESSEIDAVAGGIEWLFAATAAAALGAGLVLGWRTRRAPSPDPAARAGEPLRAGDSVREAA